MDQTKSQCLYKILANEKFQFLIFSKFGSNVHYHLFLCHSQGSVGWTNSLKLKRIYKSVVSAMLDVDRTEAGSTPTPKELGPTLYQNKITNKTNLLLKVIATLTTMYCNNMRKVCLNILDVSSSLPRATWIWS